MLHKISRINLFFEMSYCAVVSFNLTSNRDKLTKMLFCSSAGVGKIFPKEKLESKQQVII